MAITIRRYLFENDGGPRQIPRSVVEGLLLNEDAAPQYADSRKRIVPRWSSKTSKESQSAFGCERPVLEIDNNETNAWLAIQSHQASTHTRVVDLRPEIERNKWREKHLWDVSKADLDGLAAFLWPTLAEAVEPVGSVKGKAPKRPALSYKPRTLLGDEAGHRSRAYSDDSSLWNAVADEAEKQREIKARHRTGKDT
jgi:hypothetical protein